MPRRTINIQKFDKGIMPSGDPGDIAAGAASWALDVDPRPTGFLQGRKGELQIRGTGRPWLDDTGPPGLTWDTAHSLRPGIGEEVLVGVTPTGRVEYTPATLRDPIVRLGNLLTDQTPVWALTGNSLTIGCGGGRKAQWVGKEEQTRARFTENLVLQTAGILVSGLGRLPRLDMVLRYENTLYGAVIGGDALYEVDLTTQEVVRHTGFVNITAMARGKTVCDLWVIDESALYGTLHAIRVNPYRVSFVCPLGPRAHLEYGIPRSLVETSSYLVSGVSPPVSNSSSSMIPIDATLFRSYIPTEGGTILPMFNISLRSPSSPFPNGGFMSIRLIGDPPSGQEPLPVAGDQPRLRECYAGGLIDLGSDKVGWLVRTWPAERQRSWYSPRGMYVNIYIGAYAWRTGPGTYDWSWITDTTLGLIVINAAAAPHSYCGFMPIPWNLSADAKPAGIAAEGPLIGWSTGPCVVISRPSGTTHDVYARWQLPLPTGGPAVSIEYQRSLLNPVQQAQAVRAFDLQSPPFTDRRILCTSIGSGDASIFRWNGVVTFPALEILRSQPAVGLSLTATGTGYLQGDRDYFYRYSCGFDGFQESTLSENVVKLGEGHANGTAFNIRVQLGGATELNSRISQIFIYRADGPVGALNPTTLYRRIFECKLTDPNINFNSGDNTFTFEFIDDNTTAGATYEAHTGLSENAYESWINFGIAAVLNNTLFVSQCSHPDMPDADQMVFRSQPGRPHMFNLLTDFVRLPSRPTALAAYNGRIYAFDETHTYRINPDTLVIEDCFDVGGCAGPRSFTVLSNGIIHCTRGGIYITDEKGSHNLSRATIWEQEEGYGWQNIVGEPIVTPLSSEGLVLVYATFAGGEGLWYVLDVWDQSMWAWKPENQPASVPFQAADGATYYRAGFDTIYQVGAGGERSYTWVSPVLDGDGLNQVKVLYQVRLGCAPWSEGITNIYYRIDSEAEWVELPDGIPEEPVKFRTLQLKLEGDAIVQSIAIMVRPLIGER